MLRLCACCLLRALVWGFLAGVHRRAAWGAPSCAARYLVGSAHRGSGRGGPAGRASSWPSLPPGQRSLLELPSGSPAPRLPGSPAVLVPLRNRPQVPLHGWEHCCQWACEHLFALKFFLNNQKKALLDTGNISHSTHKCVVRRRCPPGSRGSRVGRAHTCGLRVPVAHGMCRGLPRSPACARPRFPG